MRSDISRSPFLLDDMLGQHQTRLKMNKLKQRIRKFICALECSAPIADLVMRVWVGNVFWKEGLQKVENWDNTVSMFKNSYMVSSFPPSFAASTATAAELVLPILLVFGIAGRAAAGALFLYNIMIVVQHPDMSSHDLILHQVWGILLLAVTLRGPGTISIDHFVRQRFGV